ncbi:MAG: hypoxanthine phosphoribosyltransferase [Nitratireductor sp.]|nr:hypoxanthine phosphoribosyltransferase [Nitratireductor sp.]MCB1455865.1 hypoxanthine phosphoribosyltransferase [Nitratireductor sp.]MCB1459306.1 hypoxanthine phosphoribosyltransferase [Nitratireductor sp.]
MPIVRSKKIEVLFSAEQIAARNRELAELIALGDLRNILVISILKGSFVFAADLIRALHGAGLAPEVEFISISSYGAGTEAGEVRLLRDVDTDVAGRDVLLIDDILESGNTLKYTRDLMLSRGARKVAIAVLLDKSMKRKADLVADYTGFECPDQFVVGYGMDVAHAFRELPFVGVVTGDA